MEKYTLHYSSLYNAEINGEVAERLKAAVLKTVVGF